MLVLLTFEARAYRGHFWNVSMSVFAFQPQHSSTERDGEKKRDRELNLSVSTHNGFLSQEMN